MITRLTSPAFSICAEVHVPAPLNVYRHRADLIQEFGRRNATFWVSWKVPARGERRLRTRIASRAGRLARTVLRPEAFEARPGFEQGPVDREVLTRQQGFDFLLRQNRSEKLHGDIALEQPVTVLGEGCRIPHRVLDAEPDKPAEQQVSVDPFDQLPLRADRIECLQQRCAQRPLRRDRFAADRRIELLKLARQRFERGIDDLPKLPAAGDPPEPPSQDLYS